MGKDRMSTAARIDELLSKFDENPRRYFAPLANEYRKAGDLTQAIALCREHLPKQPGHMSGHIVFGQALYEHGDLAEAQTVFESALALDPENLIALRHLGDIARARGDASAARRWYGRVLDADPRNDDIAALLASLAQRATPAFVAPIAPALSVETPAPEEPDVFLDEPAWHTPTIPDGAPAVAEHQAVEPDAVPVDAAAVEAPDVELLDLDALVESAAPEPAVAEPIEVPAFLSEFEPTVAAVTHAPEHADVQPEDGLEVFEAVEPIDAVDAFETVEPIDAVESFDAIGVTGIAEPAADVESYEWDTDERDAFGAEPVLEADAEPALEVPTPAAEGAAHGGVDDAAEGAVDGGVEAFEEMEPGQRSLSDAIGAFASHDPLESIGGLTLPDAFDDGQPPESVGEPREAAAEGAYSSADDFEEGLIALEWPDASQLAVRPPTPPRPLTPVASWAPVAEPDDEPAEATLPEATLAEATAEEARPEEEVWPPAVIETESLVEDIEAIEAEVPVEDVVLIEAEVPAEEGAAIEADSAVPESELAPTAEWAEPFGVTASVDPVEGLQATEPFEDRVSAEPLEPAESVEAFEDAPDLEPVGWVAEVDAFEDDERDEDPLDEDPPLSAAEIPWLAEEEAHEIDAFEEADAPDAPHSPAFVTETMAELLVAQGFVSRAVGVYEELVARRPYDAVLASRLEELRGMLTEPAPAEASTAATPVAPLAAFTPVRAATPVAVPLVAPAPRRTAREWLASVAAMRVQRRTPAFGATTVAVPTPADGLSSLFSAAPAVADDLAARSLASAFGSASPVDHAAALFDAVSREPVDEPAAPPVARAATPAAGGALYSFDRFFPDPATAAPAPAAESGPSASRAGPPAGSPSDAGADLAQFATWLKGLSNP